MGGALASLSAADLATQVLRALLDRTGLRGADVDDVAIGHAYPSGEDPALGRIAALDSGLGTGVPGVQVDRRCGSGLQSVLYAAGQVATGLLTLGDLVLVNALLLQLFIPLNFLGIVYRQIKYALADMDDLIRLFERTPEVHDAPDALPLQITQGELRFENVDFGYQLDRQILFDVSFTVPPSRKLAVVGASGAGKSTLARLLFRFYDVQGGRVLIDGQDLQQVTQQSLRAVIGIVPQDTVLFNDTLYYNLAYARPDASREEIAAAAQMAQLHDFIAALPAGYDTVVGERGLKLSGGEKQRVAIARAILKRPRILIFDEATSALDSRSEQAILQALRAVATDHTTLVIAHRLSTIQHAHEIIVLALKVKSSPLPSPLRFCTRTPVALPFSTIISCTAWFASTLPPAASMMGTIESAIDSELPTGYAEPLKKWFTRIAWMQNALCDGGRPKSPHWLATSERSFSF